MKDYKIIDNFLPTETFKELQQGVMSNSFPYYYQSEVNSSHEYDDMESYFTHKLFDLHSNDVASVPFSNFRFLLEILEVKSLIRMKVNLYPRTETLVEHKAHREYDFKHKACILYINTCDGSTILHDGTKVASIENRVLLFDGNQPHQSTSCTNKKARFNINMNYF